MTTRTVKVPNIACGHCVATIEREVNELEGVSSVKADLSSKTVTVEWQDDTTRWENIRDLLVEIGYAPEE